MVDLSYPEPRYARGPDGDILYQVFGEGPPDLLIAPPWGWNIELMWEEPLIERFMRRLASFARVIIYDKRGTSGSAPVPLGALPSLEAWTDDIGVVLDAAASDHAAIVGMGEGAQMAILFAAGHPERTSALVTVGGAACYRRHADYPAGVPDDLIPKAIENFNRNFNTSSSWFFGLNPSLQRDERLRAWWGRFFRQVCPPDLMKKMFANAAHNWDVRGALGTIRAPTCVIHRTGDRYQQIAHGRYLAEHIEGASFVEVPGDDMLFFLGDQDAILDEIQSFLTGVRGVPSFDRILATVLFTDIVSSTEHAAETGDARWREVLDRHDRLAADHVARFQGRLIKSTGDGVLATFDGPARAIRCARALAGSLKELGLHIRTGVHAGEVELRGEDVGGIAVNLASRVMAKAAADEVLVSRTVKDLVIGSDIGFTERGTHQLKGIPGEWSLFAASA